MEANWNLILEDCMSDHSEEQRNVYAINSNQPQFA